VRFRLAKAEFARLILLFLKPEIWNLESQIWSLKPPDRCTRPRMPPPARRKRAARVCPRTRQRDKELADGGSASSIDQSGNADTNLVLGNGVTLKYIGAGDNSDRQFRFNGSANGFNLTLDASGTGPINFTSATGPTHSTANQTRTLNLIGSNTGDNTLAASIGNNTTGLLSVVKNGAGTWALSGVSIYTGGTIVNAGTLLVNNASGSGTGTGAVTVNANGALGGIGVIGGAVTVNGALAPGTGTGAGTLTVNNNLTMETGSTYVWQLGSDDHAGAVDINGTLSIVSSWSLALANDGGTLGTGEYDLFTYDTFPDTLTAPTIYYGNTGWSNATVALDETGRRIYLKFGRPGDTNEDGVVDAADFITLKKNFGAGSGGGAVAEEEKGLIGRRERDSTQSTPRAQRR
jgi:autotransporter-associated beta strand protein